MATAGSTRFSKPVVARFAESKIIGLSAGLDGHRFVGVWVAAVGDRVFVRSWNDNPDGWFRAFLAEPRGTVEVSDRTVRVRARRVTSERMLDAVDAAYRDKYRTPGALKYVRGFRLPRRRRTTIELVPRGT
jgi:hypothetical protein